MSLIEMRFFSESLNMFTHVHVVLPLPRRADVPVQDLPVVTLLHGMGDGGSAWLRKTSAERYALEAGTALVIPDCGLSCYENMAHGPRYRDFIVQELPQVIRRSFPVSADRNRNFIAGCSMGGYGALKLALAHPEIWSIAGVFSAGSFEYQPDSPRNTAMLRRAYGGRVAESDAQTAADARAVNAGSLPLRIMHSCGDRDILQENSIRACMFFESLPAGAIDYRFEIHPGKHDWSLWDRDLHRFIAALPLPRPEVQLL